MTFTVDTTPVTDHKIVFNRLVAAAVAAGWTVMYALEDYTPPITGNTERRCVLRSVGLDANHQIFIQLKTDSNPPNNVAGIMGRIIFDYDSQVDFDNQDVKSLTTQWACIPIHSVDVKTYISATGTRVNMVVDALNIQHSFTMGTHLTNVEADGHPYPAFVGGSYINDGTFTAGSAPGNNDTTGEGINHTDLDNKSFMFETVCAISVDHDMINRLLSGSSNATNLPVVYTLPTDFFADKAEAIDGTRTIYPVVLAYGSTAGNLGIMLTLDGFGRIGQHGTIGERDTVTIDSVVNYVFKHPSKTGTDAFYTMEAI